MNLADLYKNNLEIDVTVDSFKEFMDGKRDTLEYIVKCKITAKPLVENYQKYILVSKFYPYNVAVNPDGGKK